MSHVEYFTTTKLRDGERIVATVDGWIGSVMGKGSDTQHNGALVLTNKRVAFIRKGFFGQVYEAIPIGKITSVETKSMLGYRLTTFHTSHDQLAFKTFGSKEELHSLVAAAEDIRDGVTSPFPAPLRADPRHGLLDRTVPSADEPQRFRLMPVLLLGIAVVFGWHAWKSVNRETVPAAMAAGKAPAFQSEKPVRVASIAKPVRSWSDYEICAAGLQVYFYLKSVPRYLRGQGEIHEFTSATGHQYNCFVSGDRVVLDWRNYSGEQMTSRSTRHWVDREGVLHIKTEDLDLAFEG